MDAVEFAQGHEEKVMVPETDDFGERLAVVPAGLDAADLAHGGERALGFNDKADELDDAAAGLGDAGFAHAAGGVLQPAGRTWKRGGHALSTCRSCSILVSRRASTRPKRVWTTQPP